MDDYIASIHWPPKSHATYSNRRPLLLQMDNTAMKDVNEKNGSFQYDKVQFGSGETAAASRVKAQSDCVSCLEYKALLMPQMLKNHEEIERYSRISSTKSIQRKNLIKQDRLLGRPGCPSIPSRSTIQENVIDMRVIQNLQPLNKQYERIAELKQRVMHVEQKRPE
ncbi:hypothetical protein MG293_006147 [Ovis ammon polii]|uniref:Uncharacterized protein n=1 Tax=Ovis ammon polii TaxID=230172 RepID=A0AAD4UC44_OVIAM|nr:hypothetical protein MG293_006147 [Ovis ammon polii]